MTCLLTTFRQCATMGFMDNNSNHMNLRTLAVVELDVCYEHGASGDAAATAFARKHNVAVRLVDAEGPTGWPTYEFVGEPANVAFLLREYVDQAVRP